MSNTYRKQTVMTEESRVTLRAKKVANIIMSLCKLYNLSLNHATDIYYRSPTSELIEEGVADLHCRSDKYLATLIWEDDVENNISPNHGAPVAS